MATEQWNPHQFGKNEIFNYFIFNYMKLFPNNKQIYE